MPDAFDARLGLLPSLIDHTLLKPEATAREIESLCAGAREYKLGAICVNPCDIAHAADVLKGTTIGIVSVVSFPLGKCKTEIKVAEAMAAVDDGATEIDMVVNRGLLIDGRLADYEAEIRKVRRHIPDGVTLKVILETGLLTVFQIGDAVEASVNAGAQYVKTGTGFFGGCTVEQVEMLAAKADSRVKVKASGGIRTLEQCRRMIAAGADRIGTSASIAIMKELAR